MRRSILAAALAVLALVGVACGGGGGNDKAASSSSGPFAPRDKAAAAIKGQEITVLLPYKIPKRLLSQFTKQTGVKVNYTVTGWDAVHSKLIVANTAKTYIADVTEFDWSFTGQFAAAGWYEPLEKALDPALVSDLAKSDAAFKAGGHTYATCYSNDFRMSIYNAKQFKAAGLTSFPATFSELGTAVAKLKASGVQYPLAIPMGATEGGVTPWYLLTLAMGGQLFDENNNPVFSDPDSAGYKALQWEADAVKNGWVSPGSVSMDDSVAFNKFTAGENASVLATGPGNMPVANDPKQSSIAGKAELGLVPGIEGPGGSFG